MNIETQLRRRPVADDSHLPNSIHPLLRRLYAMRGIRQADELERGAKGLLNYQSLNGIEQAVSLLITALHDHWRIVIVGDFDTDGATSTALCIRALRAMGYRNLDYLVPNRFEDGYGLSVQVVNEVVKKGADLIITVDNGISSHEGVAAAHQHSIKVLVTDHHLPGEILPAADAIINPNLHDCIFPSKALAGVGVAFYLMSALRAELRKTAWFEQQGIPLPNLAELLDLVALGTVADVVPLDTNNRIFVYQGLNRIRAGRCCVGIRALLEISKRESTKLTASDLGFSLGPRLNAAGRLDDMSVGVALLLTDDMVQARQIACELDGLNQTRREIEQGMQQEALQICDQFERTCTQLPYGLVIYHPEWHQGVVGILASRIKERFHRPVIAFAPAGDGTLKGSGRSVNGLHMRDALERLDTRHPGLILKFGGHAMAAGLSIEQDKFDLFQRYFSALMADWLDISQLEGVVWSDGELALGELSLEIAEILREGGPWGQAFAEPIFDGKFKLLQQRIVGEKHLKVMLEPLNGGPMLDGIAFNIDTHRWPDNSVKTVELAYKLDINEFRGNRDVQLLIQHIWPY
ncbi:single-stranded-DNA-specific exonuclease RecJ [Xenorhabdus bovienii]|uniref:single-stranded-DNA-specific exonuclease RecJ n=1 Tax=Xenorhabdus bovienii TaxID=40576 RepID=UPI0023B2A923|nr:single-stranded-DNA-specific exonuclease RecJ [Xenorhabdus bovienii]MDE9428164.1 single-stranded-DNA-specific exonuclease RecJ [Xenorhabdus bovienii]MDE9460212.1 single-stranded-DNA-specific exonuclease RecJ [Xenorhabdus bovienii]MDE9468460.1 single-stranded-DNA-specific exonuclease RecJ [Xenorhabdus bovienii]